MPERPTKRIRELLDSLYRVDSGRILATLIRLLGDFDLAEEAMHERERQFLQERIRQLKIRWYSPIPSATIANSRIRPVD
jgi:hypothetical protein